VVELDIEKAVYRGQGLGRHEGQVVFVPRAAPGDRVRVRIESTSGGFVRGRVEEVLRRSAGYRAAPCAFAAACGGCAYQGHDYAGQLALKEGILRETLHRGGAPWEGPVAVHGSPETGWRLRASLHVQVVGGAVRLGLHEEGTHRVVDLGTCLQLSDAMNAAQRAIAAALGRRPELAGRVQHVDLAESPDGARLVASLETDLDLRTASGLASLADGVPGLTGFGVVAGAGRDRSFLSLRGDHWIEATVRGIALRARVRSFFQSNRFLLEDLVDAVLRHTPEGGSVLDLYAGVGLFALPLAQRAERVRAIEIDASAVADAAGNVERSGLRNVRFERADVAAAVEALPPADDERVVLDPPRAGAGPRVVQAIARRRPVAVVYVSCDPATLARDLKAFAAEGYAPTAIEMFDLFPDTFHLETVVALRPVPDRR
jgi:23S rRNA (uracil1939-C5)-methyltransferase